MTPRTFRGPQEYVFPHQAALDGAPGTLVLTPGESYDFGTDETGSEVRPIGPAWWWEPEPEPLAAAQPQAAPAGSVPLADAYSDSYGDSPALAGAEG